MCENTEKSDSAIQPHHEQQPLCSTRLPYRQGRKLTAVKVYTITAESNHLLVFGVPSLNLRQEAKSLFLKFGNLQQFHVSSDHPGEIFTETYHAKFDRISSARIAKRMLDTKNFYGGSLHVCYAPELETVEETKQKLLQRQKDVFYRLRNLNNEKIDSKMTEDKKDLKESCQQSVPIKEIYGSPINNEIRGVEEKKEKLNMSIENTIYLKKRKAVKNIVIEKKFKPYTGDDKIEIVDFTSTEKETLSNINEALNYNKFGNEDIRAIEPKPINKIKFKIKKN